MTPRFVRLRLAFVASVLLLAARAQQPTALPQNPNQPPSGQQAGAPPRAAPAQPPGQAAQPPGPAAQAPIPGVLSAAPGTEEEMVQLMLPDADLDTILSALEIYTGRIILRPAQLPTATYNLRIKNPIPKSAVVRYIETVLALNMIGVVKLDDRAYKVTAITMSRFEAPEMITGSALELPPSNKVATKLFQLEFLRVNEFVSMLGGVLNPNYGQPLQLPNANSVMITDSVSNLQRVEVLLQHVDKPVSAGMKPKFYPLTEAKASDLVNKLRAILQPLQAQLGSVTTYNADDRTNQIILLTDPRQYPFFDELIERLDVRADPNTRNDVINLNHAKASEVVTVITTLISGQSRAIQQRQSQSVRPGQLPVQPGQPTPPATPGQPPAPNIISGTVGGQGLEGLLGSSEFSSIMTVVNDDRSNSIVVSGTADDIRLLRELVEKLDRVLAQVRIEVVIAEVTLDDQHQSGISALGLVLDGDKLVGFSGTGSGIEVANGAIVRPGTSGGFDLAADIALTTTPRKSNNAIISVPAITTSHGKQSIIFNGETRPVVTGTVSSAAGVGTGLATSSSVTQQQIGTNLQVTPYIGVDGSVQLDIKQTVEDVVDKVLVDNNQQYVIGRRETTSYVTAKSGEIIVLGGFQKRIDAKSTNRLGPIPIIGDLLGARSRQNYRQELIFFLRPTVLTNSPAIDNASTMRRIEELPTRDQIKQQLDPNYRAPESPYPLDRILRR